MSAELTAKIEALRIELNKLEAERNHQRLISWARKSLFGK